MQEWFFFFYKPGKCGWPTVLALYHRKPIRSSNRYGQWIKSRRHCWSHKGSDFAPLLLCMYTYDQPKLDLGKIFLSHPTTLCSILYLPSTVWRLQKVTIIIFFLISHTNHATINHYARLIKHKKQKFQKYSSMIHRPVTNPNNNLKLTFSKEIAFIIFLKIKTKLKTLKQN